MTGDWAIKKPLETTTQCAFHVTEQSAKVQQEQFHSAEFINSLSGPFFRTHQSTTHLLDNYWTRAHRGFGFFLSASKKHVCNSAQRKCKRALCKTHKWVVSQVEMRLGKRRAVADTHTRVDALGARVTHEFVWANRLTALWHNSHACICLLSLAVCASTQVINYYYYTVCTICKPELKLVECAAW